MLSGWFAVLLGLIAVMLLPTSLTGACSIYYALGWSTCPISGRPSHRHNAPRSHMPGGHTMSPPGHLLAACPHPHIAPAHARRTSPPSP